MLHTKEDVLSFFTNGSVHLSKKDYGFFSNLQFAIKDHKPVTSNQTKLFDKLVSKYKRQLAKHSLDFNELLLLNWKTTIVDSKQEYLDARLFVDTDKLCIKLPFNNQFIKYFKSLDNNTFTWNKLHRRYESLYNTYSLKLALTSLERFHKNVVFDEVIKRILDELNDYRDANVWKPTLIKSNDKYYIAGITETLFAHIKDISLSDDPQTLFELSRYGIKIDEEVIQNDNFKKFASSFYVTVDIDDISKVLLYLKLLNVHQITLASDMIYTKEISKEIKQKIHDIGLECYPPYTQSTNDSVLFQYSRNAYTVKKTKNVLKCITLTNSRPINVK